MVWLVGLGVLVVVGGIGFALLIGGGGSSRRAGSSSGSGSLTVAQRKSCALVSGGDIQAVFGTSPGKPSGSGNQCGFDLGPDTLYVEVVEEGTDQASFQRLRAANPSATQSDVSGVGAGAFYQTDVKILWVFDGKRAMIFTLDDLRGDQAKLIDLARRTLARA